MELVRFWAVNRERDFRMMSRIEQSLRQVKPEVGDVQGADGSDGRSICDVVTTKGVLL